jgi:hypothetical protein
MLHHNAYTYEYSYSFKELENSNLQGNSHRNNIHGSIIKFMVCQMLSKKATKKTSSLCSSYSFLFYDPTQSRIFKRLWSPGIDSKE